MVGNKDDVRKSRYNAAKKAAADAPMYAGGGAEKREEAELLRTRCIKKSTTTNMCIL
jgi:hypothetical protein